MIIIAVILLILLGAISFVLLTPLILEIDTTTHLYQLRWRGLARVKLVLVENGLRIRLTIFWWTREFDPFVKTQKKLPAKPAKKRRSISLRRIGRKSIALLRSFRLRKFYLNIDTDDYLMNAYLFPVAYLTSSKNRIWIVNFKQTNELKLTITNNGFRILKALLK